MVYVHLKALSHSNDVRANICIMITVTHGVWQTLEIGVGSADVCMYDFSFADVMRCMRIMYAFARRSFLEIQTISRI